MFPQQQFMRRAPRRAFQLGVSLIETLVTLGIAGTLLAIGVPSLTQFHDKAAVQARFQEFNSALRRARQEAMTRGELITVCALDPATAFAPEPACLPSGKDWSAGWLIYVDRDDRGEFGSGDLISSIHQTPASAGPVVGTQRYLTFRASGELLSVAAHFRFLPPGQPAVDKALPGSMLVCVNKPGRARATAESECRG